MVVGVKEVKLAIQVLICWKKISRGYYFIQNLKPLPALTNSEGFETISYIGGCKDTSLLRPKMPEIFSNWNYLASLGHSFSRDHNHAVTQPATRDKTAIHKE